VAANVIQFPFLDVIRRNLWMPLAEPLGSAEPRLKNTDDINIHEPTGYIMYDMHKLAGWMLIYCAGLLDYVGPTGFQHYP